MKRWIESHFWTVYLLMFIVGGLASYGLVTLKETDKEEKFIIVNPAEPVIIRDTVTVETVRWRAPVKRTCCCRQSCCGKYATKQEIQKVFTEKVSSTSFTETSSSLGEVERE